MATNHEPLDARVPVLPEALRRAAEAYRAAIPEALACRSAPGTLNAAREEFRAQLYRTPLSVVAGLLLTSEPRP